MSTDASPLTLSSADRERVDEVERLARKGAKSVEALVARLDERSWAVRRAVVSALARLGEPAVEPLCEALRTRRDNEARIAAAVDALSASRGDVERAIGSLLTSDDPAIVVDGAQVLGRRRSPAAVASLATLITHADDNVAVAAIEALGRIGGAAAVEPLIAAVGSGSFFRAFPAIDVLGRSGDVRAVEPLVALLDAPLYTMEAARALGRNGHELAVPPLAALIVRPSDALVRVAAAALCEVADRQSARYGAAPGVERAARQAAYPLAATRRLVQCIPGADPDEQTAICRVLGWIGGEAATDALIELLDSEPSVARAAADALARIGREAEPRLLAALREADSERRRLLLPIVGRRNAAAQDIAQCLLDPDASVRVQACDALARIGETGIVAELFGLIGDPDLRVSQAAVAAIQSLGSADTEALALDAARSPDARVRRAALRIVAYFGYPKGLDVLVAAIGDADERLRDAAIQGLPNIDDPRALDALIAAAQHPADRTRATAMRSLGQTSREPRVTSTLLAGLEDRDAWVRYYACQSLARLSDEAAADAIVSLIDDEAGQVRVAVVEALAHLHGERAVSALRTAAASGDEDVRRAALLGLGIARRPESLPVLIEAVRASDSATRLVALSAMAEFDAAEVLPALARAASDADESVRNAAVGFLAARPGAPATSALVGLLSFPALRERVVSALSLPADGRIPGLLAALEGADDDTAPLLVAALARMRRADAMAALIDTVSFENRAARRSAVAALAALSTPETREVLSRVANSDPDPEIRRAALAVQVEPGPATR